MFGGSKLVQRCRNLLTTVPEAISSPTIPPGQSTGGDPRLEALVCLRQGGLRSTDGPAWVRDLPACRLVSDLPLWSRQALLQALAQRPPSRLWADVMAHLVQSLGVPPEVPVAAAARPLRPRAMCCARPATLPSRTTPRASPRVTANRAAFFSAVDTVPASEALRSIRQAQTAASRKVTYAAAVPLYERACAKGHMLPWPPS